MGLVVVVEVEQPAEGRPVVVGGPRRVIRSPLGAERHDAVVVGDGVAARERGEPGALEAAQQRGDLLEQTGQERVRARPHGDGVEVVVTLPLKAE